MDGFFKKAAAQVSNYLYLSKRVLEQPKDWPASLLSGTSSLGALRPGSVRLAAEKTPMISVDIAACFAQFTMPGRHCHATSSHLYVHRL